MIHHISVLQETKFYFKSNKCTKNERFFNIFQIGHIFSADHDAETLAKNNDTAVISYGQGYRMTGTNKHTVMA